MLVRLIYVSYANTVMRDEDIEEILQKSKLNNSKNNISGVLMYSNRYFFQCLEGERGKVNATYLHIAKDARHSKCVQLDYRAIDTRLFAAWSMEHVPFNGVADEVLVKYSENGLFHPYDFSAGQAVSLLTEVSQAATEANAASKKSLFSWLKK